MKKIFKILLICITILMGSVIGIKIYDVRAHQLEYVPQISATTPPTSYDLRDYIHIDVENQNPFGICYAFASLTSLETYLALNYQEYYDFSEIHFATSLYLHDAYYSSINNALNNGGNFDQFIVYTQKDKSLVLEEEMPINKYLSLSNSSRESQIKTDFNNIENNFYPIVKVNDTKTFPKYVGNKQQFTSTELTDFRNSVKNHIMQYGSVTAGIHTNTSFNNNTKYYKVTDNSLVTNAETITKSIDHLISIVGWDDNYNANGAWSNKGAYLCLNSWGTSFGDDGYFYVSYDDYFIESSIQGIKNVTLSTTNNKISSFTTYPSKTSIHTHSFDGNPTIYTANIIDTSKHLNENINYIDSFIGSSTTKFYIKFFSTHKQALAGINSTTSLINSSKVEDFSLYSKYKLSTPLKISDNYMVVVRAIYDTDKIHSLCGLTSNNLNIEPSYYNATGVGRFDVEDDIWNPAINNLAYDCTMPLIVHTNNQYVQVSSFESNEDGYTKDGFIKNNTIFVNKTVNIDLTNANLSSSDLENVKITKLYKNSFSDFTSYFEITLNSSSSVSVKLTKNLNSSFTAGNYLISIPCNNTVIYRVIELQSVTTYKITYNLDGGTANNPNVYTNYQSSLRLNNPVKKGYTFIGWYTNESLTQPFDENSLPYTSLTLYAKYELSLPTLVSKSKDISVTYNKNLNVTISVVASHDLQNQYNTLSYQWYTRKATTDAFEKVEGATSSSLTLNQVKQSGYYACEISITFTDTNIVSTPCVKTISATSENSILVNINPFIYDISKVKWNYTEPFSYNTLSHTVQLLNLPSGVTATYTNNTQTNIGHYVSTATLNYDDMDGNAYISPIEDLAWEIRKAKITITVNDIIVDNALSNDELNSRYSCTIENEYLPENIVTHQDKLNYLNVKYQLINTSQPYIKAINVTTNSFDIYEIVVVRGQYRTVIHTLTDNDIVTESEKGFVQNCAFTTSSYKPNENVNKLLKECNLTLVSAYNIDYSYLDDTATLFVPFDREVLLNGLSVYMLKDNKLIKLDTFTNTDNLTFTTNSHTGTYLIVHEDLSNTSNSQIFVIVIIISIFIALCVFAFISNIKHKRNQYY